MVLVVVVQPLSALGASVSAGAANGVQSNTSGEYNGSGDAVFGNITTNPFYSDAELTNSTLIDSFETSTNNAAASWPMFRANPRHTGTNNASGVDAPVTERWRFETFDGDVYSPAIVNGTVYIGSDDDRVYAIDAENGTKQWDYYAGANIRASPAVVNGTVFFGTGDAFSSTGDVVAVDVKNQTELWNYTTGAGVESSPTVVNGTVYIGSRDGSLYALDAQSGKKIWSKTLDSSESVLSSPAVDSGTVYVGSTDGNLYAVDTKTGSQQWSFQTGDSIVYSSPTVVNDTVYVGSKDHNVYAVWATNGTQRWSFATSGDLWSSPAVVNGTVYIGSGVGNSAGDTNLYALDAGSGNKDWEFTTGAGVESSPAVVNGTIYVGSNDKNIYAIDALTGTKEWNQSTQGNAVGLSSPAVVNTTVYIGGDSDFARAFTEESSSNGEEGDDIPAAPHISSPDKAYNSTTDTSITVIYNATGEVGSQSDLGIFIKNDTGDTATQNTSLNNFKDELTFVVPAGSTQGDETLTLYLNETGSNNLATGTTTLSLFFDPTISNATAIDLKDGDGNVSDGDRIEIRVNATDETGIANVLADSTDFGGSLNTQLTAVSGESYTHNATFTVDGSNASFNGEYNISITAFDQDSAFDSSVSTGRSNTTETNQLTLDIPGNFFDVHSKSVRKLEGSGDMSDIGVEVFLTGDLINVKLNNSIGGDELEDEAVTHSTKFQINTTINGTTPRVLLGGGHNLSWTRTQHPNGSWTVSINVSPHEGDYIGGTVPKFDGTVQANISLNETVGLAIDDLQGLSDARKEDLNGSIMGTDAQQFGSPQYDEQNDTVSLLVEAPHYDVNGVNNSGFFDILLTDALLSSWGVNNASDINISAIGSETRPTSSENTSQGIRLFFPVNYSSGDIKLSPDTSGGQEKAVTAAFTLTPDEPLTDEQITFNASGSTATAGIASYEWDFNSDGSIDATGKVVNHTYGAAGTYQVTLTVTDANGTSTQKTTTVNVTQADCFIATAAFGTPSAEEIDLLRDYRDGVLLDHWAGEILVEQYYELSPPVADFVGGTDRRRGVVREAFVRPLVGVVSIGYQMGGRLLWLGLLGILGAGALGARRTNALRDISSGISRPQSPLVIGALGVSLATASLVTGVSIGVSYSTTIGVALTWAAVLLGPTSVVVALGGIVGRPVTRLTRIVLAR